jgi:hypothetical protein
LQYLTKGESYPFLPGVGRYFQYSPAQVRSFATSRASARRVIELPLRVCLFLAQLAKMKAAAMGSSAGKDDWISTNDALVVRYNPALFEL